MNLHAGKKKVRTIFLAVALLAALVFTTSALAGPESGPQGGWWEVVPEEENPSSSYDSMLYSEIAPRLREIEQSSNRVRVEVIGQSAGGRNLFLATVSAPEAMGRLGKYKAIRNSMLKDPEKAQEMIEKFGDFKVPVFINGSIHGDEYPGVDAIIRLLETLAYDDSEEVQMILDNLILLFNVVQNPDGRVLGTRRNANGFDLNRDFITQSQPEVQATVRILTEWNPMITLDLHGFIRPMLIEPCTPPHNPNYEYDLYIKWALEQAKAMEAELLAQTGFPAQIPTRDDSQGWDDWPPIFAPMYAMYHGSYGHTLETPYRDERGVDAHYAAVWGGLKFAAENRQEMVHDQIEIFRRGFLALPQLPIPDYILDELDYDQYNDMTTIDFPAAYIIPAEAPMQQSPHEAARLVDFLLFNDIEVDMASKAFTAGGVEYPKGSYIVWMDQPKRGLANTVLWTGWDISEDPGLTMYDISGWSHPLLWGVTRTEVEEPFDAQSHGIRGAATVKGAVHGNLGPAYAYMPESNVAIKATNDLLAEGYHLFRAESAFTDGGYDFAAGTFVVAEGGRRSSSLANRLANQYGLQVYALSSLPGGLTPMAEQHIAVEGDEGIRFVLGELGFDYDVLSLDELNDGDIADYDVYVNDWWYWSDLEPSGQDAFTDFFAAGGDYVGIGRYGSHFAYQAGLLDFDYDYDSGRYNGVLMLDNNPADALATGLAAEGYGFVYRPTWYFDLGAEVDVAAAVDGGDFFVSGYWPNWDTSGAAGQPIAVHGAYGPAEISLMGLNPTFRAHPEATFMLLANAIYNGLD